MIQTPKISIPKVETLEVRIEPKTFRNKVPANWTIIAVGDLIEATNTMSNETFKGTIEEFNALLRS